MVDENLNPVLRVRADRIDVAKQAQEFLPATFGGGAQAALNIRPFDIGEGSGEGPTQSDLAVNASIVDLRDIHDRDVNAAIEAAFADRSHAQLALVAHDHQLSTVLRHVDKVIGTSHGEIWLLTPR